MRRLGFPSILVFILFLHGCATAPLRGPGFSGFLSANRVMVGSVPYLPAAAIAREGGGQQSWDTEAQVCTLSIQSHDLRVAPWMQVALVDGAPRPLSQAPVMQGGELLLPESAWSEWISPWMVPGPSRQFQQGLYIRKIIVDAGHGGKDPGARGRSGLMEKSVNLDIALRLRDLLEQEGFQVVMTRDSDRFISLSRRSEIANREGADLFVSIHANASRQRASNGYEVYYLSEALDDQGRALEAAENSSLPDDVGEAPSGGTEAIVWDLLYTEHREESVEMASAICRGMKSSRLASPNRGVKSARFAVLKGSRMPSVLVEVGFITHAKEEANLRLASYRQRISEGICKGVLSFRDSYERQRQEI